MPNSKDYISSSGSDDDEPKQKKSKTVAEKKPAGKAVAKKPAKASQDEETKYEIGIMRYAAVSEFKGKKMVSIREYYQNDAGEERPGKKGISLSVEQWEKLKSHIKEIDSELQQDD